MVAPGDPKLLADAVLRLARDPQLSRELGENGYRFVEQNLQWSHLVGRWLEQLAARQVPRKAAVTRVSRVPE